MGRPASVDPKTLGPKLLQARAQGIPWKVLAEYYGLGRTRLYQIWRQAEATNNQSKNPENGE
ncbi:hypothetical protein [Fodinicurvata sediminis]|uniref:hypothetical protein n=1 Tax=Fodinicurvata sediminis TaxID=1121832 RepID=UPI0003B7BBAF|nr:hypothetical protein [Fodinicurvata sediminis]